MNRAERIIGKTWCKLILLTAVICCTLLISKLRYRSDEVNYLNSDATWHTLLTIQAYNETPISEHLFLPIVSLGEIDDKNIPWGATIPDAQGNYYYTSFSPAGYFAPWLFMKVFHLDVCERSLYIFNSVLYILSVILWLFFLLQVFSDEKSKSLIALIGVASYAVSPEILHGMGIVYWHQSLMQVTLLAQIMAYWNIKNNGSRSARIIFYGLAFINPYIEWTGYVANAGFALAELVSSNHKNRKHALLAIGGLGIISVGSFIVFAMHYLLRVDRTLFFSALKSRFMARNVTTTVKMSSVIAGYIDSFLYLWVLLIILIIWNVVIKKRIDIKHGLLTLVLCFPILENVVMKQHAYYYTYDRMKAGFLLTFTICELTAQIIDYYKNSKSIRIAMIVPILFICGLNFKSYNNNSEYIWTTDYQEDNNKLAKFINEEYSDSVLGTAGAVRGYINLLFERGIYEGTNIENLKSIAIEKGKRYAIMINAEGGTWNLYDLSGATVYDSSTGEAMEIALKNGKITTGGTQTGI